MVHLKRRTKMEKKEKEIKRKSQVPGSLILENALMQSRLGSVRVSLGTFNEFSSSSSSSSLHPFDRSRCIPRDIATVVPLCSSRLSYLLPRDPERVGQTDRWPDERALRKSSARSDIWHVRIQIRLRDHSRYAAADGRRVTISRR